jgi:tryptophanyl-tRNA synthetase
MIEFFRPMREKRKELAADPGAVEAVLSAGADKVRPILEATREEVLEAIGTGRPGRRTS